MKVNAKLVARRSAREAQPRKNDERHHRDRDNRADARMIRRMLNRVRSVDTWERARLDQTAERIHADAVKRRANHFSGLQSAVGQMRDRGETLAKIAALAEVDIRDIRAALRRARNGDVKRRGATGALGVDTGSVHAATQDVSAESRDPLPDSPNPRCGNDCDAGTYDPTRCVRCDAAMLDEDAAPRRGRPRLYCSDTCRRDASAARTAAERYGAPIRVIEVPKVAASHELPVNEALGQTPRPVTRLDAAHITLGDGEALRKLLACVAEQARLKKLDRATLTAARELGNAVRPHRT